MAWDVLIGVSYVSYVNTKDSFQSKLTYHVSFCEKFSTQSYNSGILLILTIDIHINILTKISNWSSIKNSWTTKNNSWTTLSNVIDELKEMETGIIGFHYTTKKSYVSM